MLPREARLELMDQGCELGLGEGKALGEEELATALGEGGRGPSEQERE